MDVGDLRVDPRRREAYVADRRLDLRPREFDLLAALARDPGVVWSRDDLLSIGLGHRLPWRDAHGRRPRLRAATQARRRTGPPSRPSRASATGWCRRPASAPHERRSRAASGPLCSSSPWSPWSRSAGALWIALRDLHRDAALGSLAELTVPYASQARQRFPLDMLRPAMRGEHADEGTLGAFRGESPGTTGQRGLRGLRGAGPGRDRGCGHLRPARLGRQHGRPRSRHGRHRHAGHGPPASRHLAWRVRSRPAPRSSRGSGRCSTRPRSSASPRWTARCRPCCWPARTTLRAWPPTTWCGPWPWPPSSCSWSASPWPWGSGARSAAPCAAGPGLRYGGCRPRPRGAADLGTT